MAKKIFMLQPAYYEINLRGKYGRDMKVEWVSKFEASEGKMQKDIDKLAEAVAQLD